MNKILEANVIVDTKFLDEARNAYADIFRFLKSKRYDFREGGWYIEYDISNIMSKYRNLFGSKFYLRFTYACASKGKFAVDPKNNDLYLIFPYITKEEYQKFWDNYSEYFPSLEARRSTGREITEKFIEEVKEHENHLIHEIIHFFDYMRLKSHKNQVLGKYVKASDEEYEKAYYNDNLELNAYYQQTMDALSKVPQAEKDSWKSGFDKLINSINKLDIIKWNKLTDKSKKKYKSRLYNFWMDYISGQNVNESVEYIDETEILINPLPNEVHRYIKPNKEYRVYILKDNFYIWDTDDDIIHDEVCEELNITEDGYRFFVVNKIPTFFDYIPDPETFTKEEKTDYYRWAKELDNNQIFKAYFPNCSMKAQLDNIFDKMNKKSLNESYFYDYNNTFYYTTSPQTFLTIIKNKFKDTPARVYYDFKKKLFVFSDAKYVIHSQLLYYMTLDTNVYKNEEKKWDKEYYHEEAWQEDYLMYHYLKPNTAMFQIIWDTDIDSHDWGDKYKEGYWAKYGDFYIICRGEELQKCNKIPLFYDVHFWSQKYDNMSTSKIYETIIDAKSVGDDLMNVILKNPTRKELRDNNMNTCRGAMGHSGNFYFISLSQLAHCDLFDTLEKLGINDAPYNTFKYSNKTNTFYYYDPENDLDFDIVKQELETSPNFQNFAGCNFERVNDTDFDPELYEGHNPLTEWMTYGINWSTDMSGLGSVGAIMDCKYFFFMYPNQFLNLCPKFSYGDEKFFDNYILSRKPVGIPFLWCEVDSENKIIKVFDHEGRHRVKAIRDYAFKKTVSQPDIPVAIIYNKDKYSLPDIYELRKNWKIVSQDGSITYNVGQFTVQNNLDNAKVGVENLYESVEELDILKNPTRYDLLKNNLVYTRYCFDRNNNYYFADDFDYTHNDIKLKLKKYGIEVSDDMGFYNAEDNCFYLRAYFDNEEDKNQFLTRETKQLKNNTRLKQLFGNFNVEVFSKEYPFDHLTESVEELDILKNPTLKELKRYNVDKWRLLQDTNSNYYFGDAYKYTHDAMSIKLRKNGIDAVDANTDNCGITLYDILTNTFYYRLLGIIDYEDVENEYKTSYLSKEFPNADLSQSNDDKEELDESIKDLNKDYCNTKIITSAYEMKQYINSHTPIRIVYDNVNDWYLVNDANKSIHSAILDDAISAGLYNEEGVRCGNDLMYSERHVQFPLFNTSETFSEEYAMDGYAFAYVYNNFVIYDRYGELVNTPLYKVLGQPKETIRIDGYDDKEELDESKLWINDKILYHGTNRNFDTFKVSKKGTFGKGIYLSPNYNTAQKFGNKLLKVKVNLKNPIYLSHETDDKIKKLIMYNKIDELQKMGYDGIIVGDEEYCSEVVVWNPKDVKIIKNLDESVNTQYLYHAMWKKQFVYCKKEGKLFGHNSYEYAPNNKKVRGRMLYGISTSRNLDVCVKLKEREIQEMTDEWKSDPKSYFAMKFKDDGTTHYIDKGADLSFVVLVFDYNKLKQNHKIVPYSYVGGTMRDTFGDEQEEIVVGDIPNFMDYVVNVIEYNDNVNRKTLKSKDLVESKIWSDELEKYIDDPDEPSKPEYKGNPSEVSIKIFGTTNNPNECGYILTDGKMLDFSEKRNGGQRGTRNADHRQIMDIGMDMFDFCNLGNIRYMPESNWFMICKLPTEQQFRIISAISRMNDGEIMIECMKDANDWGNSNKTFEKEYMFHTPFAKIRRDIEKYFKE